MVRCLQIARPAAASLRKHQWTRHPGLTLSRLNCCHVHRWPSCPSEQLTWQFLSSSSKKSSTQAAGSNSIVCRSVGSSDVASSVVEAGRLLDVTIGPGLQLHEQAYRVQGRVLRLISPRDVDAVLDYYIALGLDRDPYWCRAWPSAICLAQQLLQRPELVAGKKVADFGSGLGVAGLAAALAGAKEVVLLDREPMALYCGLLSAAASGIAGVAGIEQLQQLVADECSGSGAVASSAPHAALLSQLLKQQQQQAQQGASCTDASQQLDQQQQQQQHQQDLAAVVSDQSGAAQCMYRALPFDWNSSKVTERYDVILACDVLYESEAVDLVASVIPKLLKPGNSSTLMLADPPNRTVANRQRFLDLISAAQPTRLLLQESGVEKCDVQQLDPEMLGGVTCESVAVQFMVFRSAVGNDTIGLKSL